MRKCRWPAVSVLAFLFVALTPHYAHAYLDPGTASLILQGIIGAVGAGFVMLGIYWRRFVGLFKKRQPDPDELKEKSGATDD